MDENKTLISINWLTDRLDDDIIRNTEDIKYNLLSMLLSDFGTNIDDILNIEDYKTHSIFDNSIIKKYNGDNSHFSPGATIAALAIRYSEFVIPKDILKYIQENVSTKEDIDFYFDKTPTKEEDLEMAKEFYQLLFDKGFPSQSIYLLIGAIWVECRFNPNSYNAAEAKGEEGTSKGARGISNCGEGLFQITFWSQKEKLIKRNSLDTVRHMMYNTISPGNRKVNKNSQFSGLIPSNQKDYENPPSGYGNLYQLTEDIWIDLLEEYIKGISKNPRDKKTTYDYIMYDGKPNPNSIDPEDDDHTLFYSCYLFKAATGTEKTFEKVKEWSEKYMNTHKNIFIGKGKPNTKVVNGFILQVLIAYVVSLYCTNVPIEEINFDKILNV